MKRTVSALVVSGLVFLGACGGDPASADFESLAADLHDEFQRLQTRIDVLEAGQTRAGGRFEDFARRMRSDIARIRGLLADARKGAADAGTQADAAADAASEAARDLAVLVKRYDYHLRRYHGGG